METDARKEHGHTLALPEKQENRGETSLTLPSSRLSPGLSENANTAGDRIIFQLPCNAHQLSPRSGKTPTRDIIAQTYSPRLLEEAEENIEDEHGSHPRARRGSESPPQDHTSRAPDTVTTIAYSGQDVAINQQSPDNTTTDHFDEPNTVYRTDTCGSISPLCRSDSRWSRPRAWSARSIDIVRSRMTPKLAYGIITFIITIFATATAAYFSWRSFHR
jgi:hypothetical protein